MSYLLAVMALGLLAAMLGDLVLDQIREPQRLAARRLLSAPTAAPTGERVRVQGRVVEIPKPLRAPLSGAPCAAYDARADLRHRPDGRKRDLPAPRPSAAVDQRLTTFYLETDEGRVRVTGDAVQLVLEPRHLDDTAPERLLTFLLTWSTSAEQIPQPRRLRETVVKLGDEIAVCGVRAEEGSLDQALSYRQLPTRYYLRGTTQDPIIIGPAIAYHRALPDRSQG